ncbi:DUF3515 domain-containing protein [Pseudoclavibacter sp. RFBJ3]|uniref:DUF3515 domain-containing protein n=1 Tax=unclassified Pseudoclavibacter TaxID=2615177 RepID=UPI000CE8A734|nr:MULTISPECIES: DUF3515 domain-containing protein [unclassified Pseudoclavibacter]MBF4551715.1 DUF3515 family protein [Pseudoclavibacter sp. VKM Ac-2888]PPF37597.1 DUF3515 domain-containing protein [Pseudoclavibacter sp. AY1H1]PPF77245.1 DUF3515 domain-containing protein [Pseudoclavibacter sp. Z016]PPF80999.1 DUF3515 domain-containing protein [Pseudoclavibacter sp. RFBJ5]PPF94507.1 DUF3515 domain-containing protein [Pseudoclavibacter sp. RFBJ3]
MSRTFRSASRIGSAVIATAASVVLLTACNSASVPMEPAPDAAAPECAEVSVRLPSTVDGLELRLTNAQATGAWGTPAGVLLRCGVPTPGPTSEQCVSLSGIDWIVDDSQAPTYRFTSYGRTPAVEVVVDSDVASGTTVLVDLDDAVSRLPKTGACVGADDVLG